MEYKLLWYNLTIDYLYKVLGYVCIYKLETGVLDEVQSTDIRRCNAWVQLNFLIKVWWVNAASCLKEAIK